MGKARKNSPKRPVRSSVKWTDGCFAYAKGVGLDTARIEAVVLLTEYADRVTGVDGDEVSRVAVGSLTVWFYEMGSYRRICAVDGAAPRSCRTDKRAWDSADEALSWHRYLAGLPNYDPDLGPYLCVCGKWHLGGATPADVSRAYLSREGGE